MSKYLRKYNSQAEYDSDTTRPTDGSVVSKIADEVKYDGRMVFVENENGLVGIGDHLVYDTQDKRNKWVKFGTLKNVADLAPRYIDLKGVFIGNIDGEPSIMYVDALGSPAFAEYGHFKLTGFDFENGGTVKITTTQSGAGFEITYEAGSTLAELVAQINAWKTAQGSSNYFAYYSTFSADTDGESVDCKCWAGPTAATGCTIIPSVCKLPDGTEVNFNPAYGTLATVSDGKVTEIGYNCMNQMGKDAGVVFGTKQYAVYMENSGSDTFGDEFTQFMKKSRFDAGADAEEGTAAKLLYDKYNGNYAAYAAVCAELRRGDPYAHLKTTLTNRPGTAIDAQKRLYDVMVKKFDGTWGTAFPMWRTAETFGIAALDDDEHGAEAGNWHAMSVTECLVLEHQIRRTNSDPIDRINEAIKEGRTSGYTLVNQNTTYALAGAYNAGNRLIAYGTSGYCSVIGRFSGLALRVFLAFEYNH